MFDLNRRLAAEFLGTLMLVCTVVGSGIMGTNLTDDVALELLANTIPTGAILIVLITVLGPISGAHFNPAVTIAFFIRKEHPMAEVLPFIAAQCIGAIAGSILAHAMFELSLLQVSTTVRTGPAQWIAEATATFGLVAIIFGGIRFKPEAVPTLVGLYITAAYWFTSSTSFANPAVALGRTFTNTFSGIRPLDLPAFMIAQIIGALIATALMGWLLTERKEA